MSLISLSSVDTNNIVSQQPFNFKNNFPQPLVIKPNSQVALINFYHFRDDTQYHITSQNNRILYNFQNHSANGRWEATLIPNIYNAADLAVEIARALNFSNVAFQNFLFTCVFTPENKGANPPTDDKFAITYASVVTPASRGGTWAEFGADGNCSSFTNSEGDNTVSTFGVGTFQTVPTYQARNEFGIHNHEGTWECKGFSNFGRNFGLNNALTAYDFNWGSHAVALFEVKRTDTNSSSTKTIFSRDRPTIQVTLKSLVGTEQIKIQTLNGTTNTLVTKRTLVTNLFDNIRDAASGGVATSRCDYLLGFKYFKAAGADVAIQLQYSVDGGVNWVIATEADNTGATFGVNTDGIPNVMSATTITGNQINGIIYHSGQNGMRLVDGTATSLVASSNILQKSKGKFECFVLGNSGSTLPHKVGSNTSYFVLTGRKISVDYGGGVSFDIDITAHTGGQAFEFNLAGSNQQGVAGANQARATDFNSRALKMNLTKNGLGLVWDIYADVTNAGSAVIGELKLNRRGTGGSNFGRIDFLNLTGGSFNGATSILAATVDALVHATSTIPMVLTNSGIYNPANLQILANGSPLLSGHFANTDHLNEEPDSVSEPELNANLPATFAMLLNRITQHDVDTVAGINASPLKLAVGTRSGTIGSLIGFSKNFVFDSTGAETRTYTSDIPTLITSKDTTLHISIPELSNVKSFEGESSQVYKTIKVLPKADFNSDKNSGSLNYSAPYEDYIDINNGTELQLSELTIQVRQPDGTLATTLKPITRTTIKIRENPQNKEMEKMEKMLEMMERKASQNQQYIADTSKPNKVYT
jgi:hypothetical protein